MKAKTQQELMEYITLVRKKAKINQEELADYVGVSRSQIANLEAGRSRCALPMFLQMCDYLNISLCEFEDAENLEQVYKEMNRKKAIREVEREIRKLEAKKDKLRLED